MKKKLLAVMALICLVTQGCVPSLHPLYSKETIVIKDDIIGTWQYFDNNGGTTGEKERMVITRNDKNDFYKCKYHVDGVTNTLSIKIVKLDDYYYFDFSPDPEKDELNINSFMGFHLIPAHTFTKVKIEKDQFFIQSLNHDWLEEQIKNRYIRIKHEIVNDDQIIITASTKDLQKFIKKYSDHQSGDEAAFLEPAKWKRVE